MVIVRGIRRCDVGVVRDDDDRRPPPVVDLGERVEDDVTGAVVELARRLVAEEQPRAARHRDGDREQLEVRRG